MSATIEDLELAGFVDHPDKGYWGYPNGTSEADKPLTIVYYTGVRGPLFVSILNTIVQSAKNINFTIQLVGVSFNTLYNVLLRNLNLEMYFAGWQLGAPPSPVLYYGVLGPTPANKLYGDYEIPAIWKTTTELAFAPQSRRPSRRLTSWSSSSTTTPPTWS